MILFPYCPELPKWPKQKNLCSKRPTAYKTGDPATNSENNKSCFFFSQRNLMFVRSGQSTWFLAQRQEILSWVFDQRNFYHKREWQIDFSLSFVLKMPLRRSKQSWKKIVKIQDSYFRIIVYYSVSIFQLSAIFIDPNVAFIIVGVLSCEW